MLLAGPLLVLSLLAGCGGGTGDNGVASLNGSKVTSTGKAADSDVPTDPDKKALKFAQCLREHGMDVPDPKPGSGGGMMMPALPADASEAADKAMDACKKYAPVGDIDPNDPKVKEKELKFAKCMREHGVDTPDPGSGQGQMLNADDEKTRKALEACGMQVPSK
ncbi:hypothetical protein GCM10010174_68530 [Kutzneria viridogrisea]|uniref:Uncharacterized protein n=2 Tax=Kutzneria TaxID=43356 RepID=W5WER2_9PSEU|nr:hypothetical protein KALB_5730 [Kutzneria albida DSM 43870]